MPDHENNSQPEKPVHDEIQQFSTPLCKILSTLEPFQVIAITPKGSSMCPFFYGGRDTLYIQKAQFPLKRGDIALYKRKSGTMIVHRIHHICEKDYNRFYYFLGDNQTKIEGPLPETSVLGITSYYIRKGKKIDCTSNWKYNLLWRIWMFLRPLRPLFMNAFNYFNHD